MGIKYKTRLCWSRCRYKIKYHHVFIGDTETKKAEDYVHTLIRRVGKAGIDWKIGTSWKVGTRVESRYRGPGKDFYKGKITAIHGNPKMPLHQSYDILYDDKDTIKRQPRYAHTLMEEVMCEGDPNPPGKGEPMWIVGTKVTANFKGKGSWYNGVISAAHADGTYDILYDDGDLEKNKAPYDYGCVWHGIRKSDAKFKDITEGYPSVEKKAEWKKAGKKRPPKSIQCPKTVQHPKKGRIETEDICAKITDYWQIHAPLQCKVSK